MANRKREIDQLRYLVKRIARCFLFLGVYWGVACFVLMGLLCGISYLNCWQTFIGFGGGSIGLFGLCITFNWLAGGFRWKYKRKLLERRRIAHKRRKPCALSIELGLPELEAQANSNTPVAFDKRMVAFLLGVRKLGVLRKPKSLWESDGLQLGVHPPRPVSYTHLTLPTIYSV